LSDFVWVAEKQNGEIWIRRGCDGETGETSWNGKVGGGTIKTTPLGEELQDPLLMGNISLSKGWVGGEVEGHGGEIKTLVIVLTL